MQRPLLITRPTAQSEEFAQSAQTRCPGKFQPVISPLLEIRPEPASVDISGAQALLFSSRNAVREFATRSSDRSLPALCVGNATATEASSFGFSALSANGDASALATLAVQSYLPDFGFMLHFRGAESTGDLVGSLMAEGVPAEERIIYDQFPLYLTAEAKSQAVKPGAVAVVFSPRSSNLLADELSGLNTDQLTVVAISEAAARPFANKKVAGLFVAELPNSQAILKTLEKI